MNSMASCLMAHVAAEVREMDRKRAIMSQYKANIARIDEETARLTASEIRKIRRERRAAK